jgi:hypothetical protein
MQLSTINRSHLQAIYGRWNSARRQASKNDVVIVNVEPVLALSGIAGPRGTGQMKESATFVNEGLVPFPMFQGTEPFLWTCSRHSLISYWHLPRCSGLRSVEGPRRRRERKKSKDAVVFALVSAIGDAAHWVTRGTVRMRKSATFTSRTAPTNRPPSITSGEVLLKRFGCRPDPVRRVRKGYTKAFLHLIFRHQP